MAKQDRLPGVQDPVIEEIENAATEYENARDRRVAQTKVEVETKNTLIACMTQHGKKRYQRGDLQVIVHVKDATKTVKVKRVSKRKKDKAA